MSAEVVIYTITCFEIDKRKIFGLRSYEPGFYFKREDAEHAIENNQCDMSERGYYRYALLTKKEEGPYAIPLGLQWYFFNWVTDIDDPYTNWDIHLYSVDKIDMPPEFKQVCLMEKKT